MTSSRVGDVAPRVCERGEGLEGELAGGRLLVLIQTALREHEQAHRTELFAQERQVAGGARQRRQQRVPPASASMRDLVVGRVDGADGLDERARHLGLRGHDCHLGSRALTQVIHGRQWGVGGRGQTFAQRGTSCTCSLDPYASPAVTRRRFDGMGSRGWSSVSTPAPSSRLHCSSALARSRNRVVRDLRERSRGAADSQRHLDRRR